MENPWRVKIWGVRGSVPVAAADFLEYGGNTSCISVDLGDDLVVFDAGSGLLRLGSALKGRKRLSILLSHLHMDHIIGFFGFTPFYDPDMEIHLYGGRRDGAGLRERLEALLGPPYWPVGLPDFPARVSLHEIGPGERFYPAAGAAVDALEGSHPNGCLLYRLRAGEKSLVYGLDCEMDGGIFPLLAEFSRDAGLLVWDANFTAGDLKPGWGHSTWEQGLALGRAAGAKTVLMTHYSRHYSDEFLREQERLARQTGRPVLFAKEGMELIL